MTDRKGQLKDIVNGLVIDIFQAEEALALDKEIGINADPIKEAKFEELFGSLQNMFVAHLILAVTKLFEPRSQRHPTRSIPAALDILYNYSDELEIEDKQPLAEKLIEFKYGKETVQYSAQLESGLEITQYREKLQALSDPDITKLVVEYFSKQLPDVKRTESLSQALNALKTHRDKRIAHHEVIKLCDSRTATYAQVDELLDYTKQFVVTVGTTYFGDTVYEDWNGNYLISSDAGLASRQLKRLFVDCKILKNSES